MPISGPSQRRGVRPPLDPKGLEALALRYVERYAATQRKVADYLRRKIGERGWHDAGEPPVNEIVARLAALGYVDDRAFAESKAGALGRRGYGPRRIDAALRGAGVSETDGAVAAHSARAGAIDAALAFARRKRIGPFAPVVADRPARERAIAILVRAGHDFTLARRIAEADPGDPATTAADHYES